MEPNSSLPQTCETFEQVANYLIKHGVKSSNVRIKSYREFLEKISIDNYVETKVGDASKLWREVHEILLVITTFINHNIHPPSELLIKAFDGRPLDEYTHDAGRNFFLELRAAIYFLRAGYEVTLDEDCDIIAIRKKRRIFIECKRIYSEKKVRDRIQKCYAQLAKRLSTADKKFSNHAVAWIDPSPAMQKQHFLYTAYSERGVRNAAAADLMEFWKQWVSMHEHDCDTRIFAMVMQVVWPGWVSGVGVRTGFTSLVVPAHKDIGFLEMWRVRGLMNEVVRIDEA